jgi:hypothetical protein
MCRARERGSTLTEDLEQLNHKLADLEIEHRDLDSVIARVVDSVPFDQIQLQRLKKRKLLLKDEIIRVRSKILPDIIA